MPLVATLCQLVLQIAIKWVVRPAPPGVSVRLEDSFPLPVFRLVQKEHWISKLQKDRFSFQWIHGRLWNFPNSQDTQGKQFFWQIFFFVLFRSINSWTLKSKSLQPVVSRFEFFFFWGTLATALAYSKAAHLERQHRDLAYSENWLENIHVQLYIWKQEKNTGPNPEYVSRSYQKVSII